MHPRFFLAPVAAALTVLTFSAPASAQSADLHADLLALRREVNQNRIAVARVVRVNDRCETPDPDEIVALMATANALSRRASAIAPRVAARDHVLALGLAEQAETSYVHLRFLEAPDICYVPPAE
jgi:hypothetical protein